MTFSCIDRGVTTSDGPVQLPVQLSAGLHTGIYPESLSGVIRINSFRRRSGWRPCVLAYVAAVTDAGP